MQKSVASRGRFPYFQENPGTSASSKWKMTLVLLLLAPCTAALGLKEARNLSHFVEREEALGSAFSLSLSARAEYDAPASGGFSRFYSMSSTEKHGARVYVRGVGRLVRWMPFD